MNLLPAWIRHLLILLPAVATLYVEDIPSAAEYIASILLGLLLVRIIELRPSWSLLLIPVEIAWFGWIAHSNGGLLFLLLYSSLLAVFIRIRRTEMIAAFVVLIGIVLNLVIAKEGAVTLWMVNLTWLTLTALLTVIHGTEQKQGKIEGLYDELSRSHEELQQARRRMLDYAMQVEDYAQAEERGRIAKEIHDDLGHRLIRLKMMMEAVLQLLDREPDRARAMLEQIRGQLEESMDNMRRTVRKLKPPEVGGARTYALDRLIEEAGRDLRIGVQFQVTGRPAPLYPSVEYVLYRNVQEAITNAVRHGGATAVEVELDFRTDAVVMSVANDGALPQSDVRYGLGMRGMQERIEMLGGRLLIGSEGRFSVTTILPFLESKH
jgi:two-component system NarL family sensor kinase